MQSHSLLSLQNRHLRVSDEHDCGGKVFANLLPIILYLSNAKKLEADNEQSRSKSFINYKYFEVCFRRLVEILVWSGIKKGPPRKLKFPEADLVIKAVEENL